ncbi:hypothetical protein [Glycomyces sp. MUSA5-2]|uniref:hypothetical protein n=1 Tax=Glycomyces sp. MUSA5-2 TaxID=2053002 RepID=UPI00300B5DA0
MCTTDGDHAPAQWRGLGEDSEIPFDDATLGNGESEGSEQNVEAFAADAGPVQGVEEILAGQDADALVTLLESTPPDAAAQTDITAQTAANVC